MDELKGGEGKRREEQGRGREERRKTVMKKIRKKNKMRLAKTMLRIKGDE